jgi:hypothetical protein
MFIVLVFLVSFNMVFAAAQAENLVEVIVIIILTATSPPPPTPPRPPPQHHAGTQSGGTN